MENGEKQVHAILLGLMSNRHSFSASLSAILELIKLEKELSYKNGLLDSKVK